MSPRLTLLTAARILRQLRHDRRTIAMIIVIPTVLLTLLRYLFEDKPLLFDSIGLTMLGVFPLTIMFLLTSVAMLRELAQAAGGAGMCGGQALDLAATGSNGQHAGDGGDGDVALRRLERLHALKTGALISASVGLGALCAAVPEQSRTQALAAYAERVGLAFQIQDDILDETADSTQSGKTRGADRARNKPTYTSLLGLAGAREKADTLADEAVNALRFFGPEADRLRELARFIVERTH